MADLMSDLVPASGSQIDLGNAYEVLAAIPAENLWLANFTSQNTRESYRRALGQFIAPIVLMALKRSIGECPIFCVTVI